jgi:hypothetical protein
MQVKSVTLAHDPIGKRMVKFVSARAGLIEAAAWMFGLSFILTLLLAWVPVVGPFVGPALGGYVGGYKAGTVGRAMLAAVLPSILLSVFILIAGFLTARVSDLPILGVVGVVAAGAIAGIIFIHNLLLFFMAFIGGIVCRTRG